MNLGTPDGFSESMVNPYGYEKGKKFILSEENELFVYKSWDTNSNLETGNQKAYWLDKYKKQSNDPYNDFETWGEYTKKYALAGMVGVGFDPYGNGKKDHIAIVGYDHTSASLKFYVIDTVNNTTSSLITVETAGATWQTNSNAPQDLYTITNYYNIVAGDFNGDNREEIVVSYVGDNKEYGLSLIVSTIKNDSSVWLDWSTQTHLDKSLIHSYYNDFYNGDNNKQNKIIIDLAVGDVNGDNIDDLICLSSISQYCAHNTWAHCKTIDYGRPQLGILYGKKLDPILKEGTGQYVYTGSLFGNIWIPAQYIANNNIFSECQKSKTYVSLSENDRTMILPSVACGDINGDNIDEVVVAGYEAILRNASSGDVVSKFGSASEVGIRYASYTCTNGVKKIEDLRLSKNKWMDDIPEYFDKTGPKLIIETVYIDGKSNPAHVFIQGDMYKCVLNENKLNVDNKQTLNYFTSTDDGAGGSAVGKHVIQQVAVGNFDGNEYGYEQIAYTVALQGNTSKHYYYFMLQMAGGENYADNISNTYYNKWDEKYVIDGYEHGYSKRTNVVIASIDKDDDGVVASYRGADYVWTDPQIRAVLQASPYFKDLYDAEYITDDYETTYETSVTYGYEKSKTTNVSFGAGVCYDADFKFMTLDAKLGFALDWSSTYTKSLQTTYTQSFSAKLVDTVVLYRTPVFIYSYDIWTKNDNGENDTTRYEICVPKGPVYDQISVDSYNSFVTYYNNKLIEFKGEEEATPIMLNQINKEELYLDNSGNPYGYYNTNGSTTLSKAPEVYGEFKNIARNGGSNGSSYEISEEESKSKEATYGFSFELALAGGFTGKGFEMHLGGYVDLQVMFGGAVTTTNGVGTSYSGSVSGIYTDDMRNDGFNPDDWGFAWTLASWDSGILNKSPNTKGNAPVIGYVLRDVVSPSAPVENLDTNFDRENDMLKFDLNWDSGDESYNYGTKTSGYNIYLFDNLQNKYQLIKTINDPQVTTYQYTTEHDGREYYSFIVKSFNKKYETSVPIESLPSYAQQFMPTASNAIISITKTATSDDGLVDTYTILFADYSTQTFTVTNGRAILSITKIATNDETGLDTYQITFSDGDTHEFYIQNGINGQKGEQGVGIKEIVKLSTEGDIVNYEIIFTDNSKYQFTMNNGRGIVNVTTVNFDEETGVETFRINFSDGSFTEFNVQNAMPWQKGDDGVVVSGVMIDDEGNFIFTLTDGSQLNAGKLPSDYFNNGKNTSSKCSKANFGLFSFMFVVLPFIGLLLKKKH